MFTRRRAKNYVRPKMQVRIEPETEKLVRRQAGKDGRMIQVEVNRALNTHYTGKPVLDFP